MSNSLYNSEVKEKFLKALQDSSSENTVVAYKRILRKASKIETRLNKDLYNFHMQEIEQFIIELDPASLSSAIHGVSIVYTYIRWAIKEGLTKGNLEVSDFFRGKETAEKVMNKQRNVFTYDQIKEVIKKTENDQDKALILALFLGIMGKKLNEISNLKFKDINRENNVIDIRGEESARKLKLENEEQKELIELLMNAYQQEKYIKNNGAIGKIKSPRRPLVRNEHIFRPMIRTVSSEGLPEVTSSTVSYFTIRNRIVILAEQFNLPTFGAVNIRNSGMLFMAYQEYKANGERLTKESKRKIYKFYNVGKSKTEDRYHSHIYEREFLNEATIREMYYEEILK